MPKAKPKPKPLEIAVIETLTKQDYDFCLYRALNKSDVESYQLAYGTTKSAAASNAWRKASVTEIIEATNFLRKQMANSRVESAILTEQEILGFCARAMRTPLSQLDEHDPLVVEMTTEVSPMGSVKKKYKKANPLDAAKVALTIISNGDNSAPKPIGSILLQIINQGIPEERDVTPINDQ
jgi:hypothetical protein